MDPEKSEASTASSVVNPDKYLESPDENGLASYFSDKPQNKYEEAALYVKEGNDYEKFACHPSGKYSKWAFSILHNPFVYIMEFVACCLLMGLAIIEEPAMVNISADNRAVVVVIHSTLEIFFLSVIAATLFLRLIWMKPRVFFFKASALAAIIVLVMFVEAVVVLLRRESHFRVTRCLRPFIFINTYLLSGVQRIFNQLIQCLKPILDVMLLLLLIIATFSLAGYYLFADINPTYFDTYLKSFVSLLIALTTANHPDVFMEAYVRNRASPLFFILYLFVTLYFFQNVLLGILYEHFGEMHKNRFKKLYLHKREALSLAYRVLDDEGKGIDLRTFMLFMYGYNPRIPEYQIMCTFDVLQENKENLFLDQFLKLYEVLDIKWKQLKRDGMTVTWYEHFPTTAQYLFGVLNRVKSWKYFDSAMALVVVVNAFFLTLYTLITSFYCGSDEAHHINDLPIKEDLIKYCQQNRFRASHDALIGSFIFTIIYMIEIAIRILAEGPVKYFKKIWNRYDFMVILLSFIFLCIEASTGSDAIYSYLVFFRPVKLLRLVKLKKRYYRIINTVSYISDRLISALILLFMLFYFYAIIGMEVFKGAIYVGCCDTALFNTNNYYQASANTSEFSVNVYWLNNFNNIYQSYVILYEEMVVNNWFIQMEGFVSETSIFARVYFIAFWMTHTVCLSVVIAYIVDAFTSGVQSSEANEDFNKNKLHSKYKSMDQKRFCVELSAGKINTLRNMILNIDKMKKSNFCSLNLLIRSFKRVKFDLIPCDELKFKGRKRKTKEYMNLKKYNDELGGWIQEREEEISRLKDLQEEPSLQILMKRKMLKLLKGIVVFLLE